MKLADLRVGLQTMLFSWSLMALCLSERAKCFDSDFLVMFEGWDVEFEAN